MSGGRTLLHLLTKAALGLGALFLVGVLLAAIPNHRTPVVASVAGNQDQDPRATAAPMDHSKMPGMDMDDAKANEHGAMEDMEGMHHGDSAHMYMTTRLGNSAISNAPMKLWTNCGRELRSTATIMWP